MTSPHVFDDATVAAYVDDELDATTRARIEDAARTDETLAARIQAQAAMLAMLRATYDPVAAAPTPARFLHVVHDEDRPPAEVVDLASRRKPPKAEKGGKAGRQTGTPGARPAFQGPLPAWAGMVACAVVGLIVGRMAAPPTTAVTGAPNQVLTASGPLARALERQLASAPPGDVRIGVSFRNHDGAYCRSFQPNGKAGMAGVACRDHDTWRLKLATPVEAAAATAYRTAGAETPPSVLAAVDALIDGAPLDAKAEAASMKRGWRP